MKFLLRLCVLAIIVTAGCAAFYYGFAYESSTRRFRLGFDVDVGATARSGSSVIVVTWNVPRPPLGAILKTRVDIQGTAPTINLRPYGRLFAMLSPSGDPDDSSSLPVDEVARRALRSGTGRVPLLDGQMPQFVWLPTKDDAISARRVSPADFAAMAGGAVRFHGAWIEPTSDPVARTLEVQFPELVDNIPGTWERHGAMRQPVFRLLRSNLEQ